MRKFYNGKYDGFASSPAILAAIEEIAGDELTIDDGSSDVSEADRIWSEPTADEIKRVEARAWELADDAETELHWGETSIERP